MNIYAFISCYTHHLIHNFMAWFGKRYCHSTAASQSGQAHILAQLSKGQSALPATRDDHAAASS